MNRKHYPIYAVAVAAAAVGAIWAGVPASTLLLGLLLACPLMMMFMHGGHGGHGAGGGHAGHGAAPGVDSHGMHQHTAKADRDPSSPVDPIVRR
jgi:hypothetical protein